MQATSVNFDAAINQAELDYQDIVDHPHEVLKTFPDYNELYYWHGGDPLLAAFSVGSLYRFGAINVLNPLDIYTVPRYPAADESLKNQLYDRTKTYNDSELHPVFRRKNFLHEDDYDYELLKPVLKLATDILGSFEALGFFAGLLKAKQHKATPEEEHRLGKGLLWKFSPEIITSSAQAVDAITHLRDLGDYVEWIYKDSKCKPLNHFMGTYTLFHEPVRPRGFCSFIAMQEGFRDSLRRRDEVSKVHPGFDQSSADLRIRFNMAIIMIHEIAHAFNVAYSPKEQVHEPFMNDDRIAELGYALTTHLLGGVVKIAGSNPLHFGIPFGLYFIDWPNSENYPATMKARHSLAKAGVHNHTYYSLHMDHLLKVLKPQFWREEAERFGDSTAMKMPKLLGVRYRYDHQLWSGEGPVEMETEAALPPGSLRPDVGEGIIWQDGAVSLGKNAEYYKDTIADWTAAMKPWDFSETRQTKIKPLTWDTIDRFHPGQFNIITEPPPLNIDPNYDPVRYKRRLRHYIRNMKLEKRETRARKIDYMRKSDRVSKGPPVRKRKHDEIDYELPGPPTPSPPAPDRGFYPRANPQPRSYDPDLKFPRVPYTGKTLHKPPPYNSREKWKPNWKIDFGDGGAYPEIDYQQYPLDMGDYADSYPDSDDPPLSPSDTPKLDY